MNQTEGGSKNMIELSVLNQLEELQSDGEPDIIIEVIDLFLTTSLERVEAIQKFSEKDDRMSASRQAHALKSSAKTLGALELGDLCQKIEDLKNGGMPAELHAFVKQLEISYELTCKALIQLKSARFKNSA